MSIGTNGRRAANCRIFICAQDLLALIVRPTLLTWFTARADDVNPCLRMRILTCANLIYLHNAWVKTQISLHTTGKQTWLPLLHQRLLSLAVPSTACIQWPSPGFWSQQPQLNRLSRVKCHVGVSETASRWQYNHNTNCWSGSLNLASTSLLQESPKYITSIHLGAVFQKIGRQKKRMDWATKS